MFATALRRTTGFAASLTRQAALLGISRDGVYRRPGPVSDADLASMRRIDGLHLDDPPAGSRMLTGPPRQDGDAVGRLHIPTSMKRTGNEAIHHRPGAPDPILPGLHLVTEFARICCAGW